MCSPFWRFYHNQRGGCAIAAGGRRYELAPGVVTLVPAGVMFDCLGKPGVPHLWIHFTPEGPLARMPTAPLQVTCDAALAGTLDRLRKRLAAQRETARVVHHVCQAALHLAFAEAAIERHAELSPRLRALLSAIEHGLAGGLTNGALAAQAGLSVEGFARWFRAGLGLPPAAYVRRRRVAEACRLLAYTEQSIEEIAERTGFKNRHHFSRVFGREMGAGPAAFRRGARRA